MVPAARTGSAPGARTGSQRDEPEREASRPRIVLASSSPRRRELLAGLGLEFEIVPADIDESSRRGEEPEAYVDRLAFAKARTVAERIDGGSRPAGGARRRVDSDRRDGTGTDGILVIAADTVVVVDGDMLGKPRDADENRAFLDRLAGREHRVSTGHCLIRGDRAERVVCTTTVVFRGLSDGERERYVATGEGADKAGGYAIQGVGASLVERIDGCYFNVVGMSLAAVVTAARRLGVALV